MQNFGGLAAYRQFIVWAAEPKPDSPGETKKYAVNPATGYEINTHDPANWLSLEEARAAHARYTLLGPRVIRDEDRPAQTGCGVGFVFTEHDPFFFFDLDNALQPDGTWSVLAQQMCQFFAGCFVEVSQSGTGLHIIGAGTPPPHGCKNQAYKIELYHRFRFCALTGTGAQGSAFHDATPQLQWLAATYFPHNQHTAAEDWTDGPCEEWDGPEDDDELLSRILNARGSVAAAFGMRATFRQLWERDVDALAQFYPPAKDSDSPYDRSDADIALCQHLAFWTGKDCSRIDRLYRRSALYRDKWERDDYRERTAKLAVGRCKEVYGARQAQDPATAPTPVQPAPVLGAPAQAPAAPQAPPAAPGVDVAPALVAVAPGGMRDGFQFLGITQQQQHFAGCVYIRESHKIWVPDGSMLKPDQFKATYGGYVFALDMINDKTTRNAWEAFTESQAFHFPKAHEICFRPETAPGAMIQEEGFTLVNTYVPVETRRVAGDPTPFFDLLQRILPDERDRVILLSYMAAMVQTPGAKFQWWPVIQGTEGNGKSAVLRVLNHAIGNRYTHIISNAKALVESGNKFNAWVEGRLFVGIEEIYTPERRDFLEAFKTMVTNDRLQIEGKGTNQKMGDNRCNGIMCTNHKDGVPVTIDNRRYCILFTAQQSKEDKTRDGMTGAYFPELYDWFKGTGRWSTGGRNYGYAVVSDWLQGYQVPAEFDPRGLCQEAPRTSSTDEAIRCSRGSIEQEVVEATEEGRPGFSNGWISSKAFDLMLEDRRAARSIPPNRRREILRGLGYDWHPGLRDGRVSNPIADPAGHGKPRLYIRAGHIHGNLQSPAEIARHYLEAQQGSTVAAQVFGGQVAA